MRFQIPTAALLAVFAVTAVQAQSYGPFSGFTPEVGPTDIDDVFRAVTDPEVVEAPLVIGGVLTTESYSGFVRLDLAGSGTNASIATDSYYTFEMPLGNPVEPFARSDGSWIAIGELDGGPCLDFGNPFSVPASNKTIFIDGIGFTTPGPLTIPVFDESHGYSIVVDLGSYVGPIYVGNLDCGFGDNTGSLFVTVTGVVEVGPTDIDDVFRAVTDPEVVEAPLVIGGVLTTESYSGFVRLDLAGSGTNASIATDSYYTFEMPLGNPVEPVPPSDGSWIAFGELDGGPCLDFSNPFAVPASNKTIFVDGIGFTTPGPLTIPVFDESHGYSIVVDLGSYTGPIYVGNRDCGFGDNTGSLFVTVTGVVLADISGRVTGLQGGFVFCRNLTTGEEVTRPNSGRAWTCQILGLDVADGDVVITGVVGISGSGPQ